MLYYFPQCKTMALLLSYHFIATLYYDVFTRRIIILPIAQQAMLFAHVKCENGIDCYILKHRSQHTTNAFYFHYVLFVFSVLILHLFFFIFTLRIAQNAQICYLQLIPSYLYFFV